MSLSEQEWLNEIALLNDDDHDIDINGLLINDVLRRAMDNTIVELLKLYDIIQDVKQEERKKQPYRFNVLIGANPSEPDVSRILAGFFMQKTNGDYRVLKDFVRTFWGASLAAMITNPTISTEETVIGDYRTDILICEKDKYAIVLENKIWDAVDQPHQLANYIDAMLSSRYGFSMEQIYVAFLPKTNDHEPSLNSWKSQEGVGSYKEEFQDRYRLLDFAEKILPWLESSKAVQGINNEYFEHSRFLFIDFLKRKLDLDSIDKMEQKEIEKKLREHLCTDDAVADAGKLLQMIDKLPRIPMDEVVKRLNVLRKDRTKDAMQQWKNKLEEDYPDYVIWNDIGGRHMVVGVNVPYGDIHEYFSVFIWNYQNKASISVAIALTKDGTPYRKEIEPKVEELIRGKKGFRKGREWLFFKDVSYEEAYPLLQELVRELPNI